MREGIHPKYVECKVECACGNSFVTMSTKPEIKLDICSKCHPFFTGKQKLIDTAGRVDKFLSKYSKTGGKTLTRKPKKVVMKVKPLKKIKKAIPKEYTKKDSFRKSGPKSESKAEPKSEQKKEIKSSEK
ncbi:MAG: 50S ribosomal protein L31 [Elusimicrobia bacterium]|nr:50S ribosomal protein L31 [Elusimicrobiota bacterium]